MTYISPLLAYISPSAFQRYAAPWAFELLLIMLLLAFVEFALRGSARLASMSPNPFWIPVLLLSVQYGAGGGLAAAVAAIALNWILGSPAQASGEDFYDYTIRIWREPILWLGAAVILGGFRTQELHKLEAQSKQIDDAIIQRQAIAALCDRLKTYCEDLERRIACASDRSIENGLAALAALSKSSIACLNTPLAEAVELLLGSATYSVWVRRDGRLFLSSGLSSPAEFVNSPEGPVKLSAESEDALVQEARMLSILNVDDAQTLGGKALLAAPILSICGDRVIGAFLIHTLDVSRFGPDLERGVQALCRALSVPLGRDRAPRRRSKALVSSEAL
jgi:hypothetical protein